MIDQGLNEVDLLSIALEHLGLDYERLRKEDYEGQFEGG